MNDPIEIPLSKTKIVFLSLGALAFVLAGVLFMVNPSPFVRGILRSPEIVQVLGGVSILFFGLGFFFLVKKLLDKKVGLRIDEQGITDHSGGTSVGLIEWTDIKAIEVLQVVSTKILMIHTDKPEKYIERAKNGMARRAMMANNKLYGSPLSIASNALKINFGELEKLIRQEFEKRKV